MGREDRTVEDFTVIANETVPRTVVYDEDSNLSNEVIIFETNSVDDQEYYFQVRQGLVLACSVVQRLTNETRTSPGLTVLSFSRRKCVFCADFLAS